MMLDRWAIQFLWQNVNAIHPFLEPEWQNYFSRHMVCHPLVIVSVILMCRYELHLVVVTIYLLIRLAMLMLFLTIWIVAFGIDNAFSYKYNQKLGNCGEDGLAISCEHGTCHVIPVSSCPRYAFHQWPPYINPFGMFASFFLIISRKIVRYICVGDSTECITIFANQVEYI